MLRRLKDGCVKRGRLIGGLRFEFLARRPSEGTGCLKEKAPRAGGIFLAVFRVSGGIPIHFLPLGHVSWDSDRVPASQPCRGYNRGGS